jgi:hypothetical protein
MTILRLRVFIYSYWLQVSESDDGQQVLDPSLHGGLSGLVAMVAGRYDQSSAGPDRLLNKKHESLGDIL